MLAKRWTALLFSLLMLAAGPSWAACPMTGAGVSPQMQSDMTGPNSTMPSHEQMPCKDATPQCIDGTGCVTLAALPQSDSLFTPPHLMADRLLPNATNGPSLSIKPDIPPPIAIV